MKVSDERVDSQAKVLGSPQHDAGVDLRAHPHQAWVELRPTAVTRLISGLYYIQKSKVVYTITLNK